jgi:hypothetical protein
VKSLEPSKFGDIDEVNVTNLLYSGLLTQHQIDGYKKFVEKDSIKIFEEIRKSVENTENWPEIFKIAQDSDNPYSEAQFKTLKYCPQFPGKFGSIEDARVFCQDFFGYYNKL